MKRALATELAAAFGAPGGTLTHDLWLRKPPLFTTELREKGEIESAERVHQGMGLR